MGKIGTSLRSIAMRNDIDTTFDFRSDTPPGRDADSHSPTLRNYHKCLWSKPLPSGVVFELDDTTPRAYLHHRSVIGEFFLSSDAVIPTFKKASRISHIIEEISAEELHVFDSTSYTIGGMMIFPGNRIGRKMTINGQRGCHHLIKDRFDLTAECIRRYYRNEPSPLSETLERYGDFFALFGNFRGYVEFFLLQDLVTEDCSAVKFFMPFNDFIPWPLPTTTGVYRAYKQHALDFIEARNNRILASS